MDQSAKAEEPSMICIDSQVLTLLQTITMHNSLSIINDHHIPKKELDGMNDLFLQLF